MLRRRWCERLLIRGFRAQPLNPPGSNKSLDSPLLTKNLLGAFSHRLRRYGVETRTKFRLPSSFSLASSLERFDVFLIHRVVPPWRTGRCHSKHFWPTLPQFETNPRFRYRYSARLSLHGSLRLLPATTFHPHNLRERKQ